MRKSEILREAKKLIEIGCADFICDAIGCVARYKSNVTLLNAKELKDWIGILLDGCGTYGEWLDKHHPNIWKSGMFFKHARLQWLDWMIAYWEEQDAE
jgi:hypothetical protein